MQKIIIELSPDGNIRVQMPQDPGMCLMLLEVAKVHAYKKLLGLDTEPEPKIIIPSLVMGRPT